MREILQRRGKDYKRMNSFGNKRGTVYTEYTLKAILTGQKGSLPTTTAAIV
jgi:hypothetical protein